MTHLYCAGSEIQGKTNQNSIKIADRRLSFVAYWYRTREETYLNETNESTEQNKQKERKEM
jgi:hypothetical protein